MKTIADIIEAAGGPAKIVEALAAAAPPQSKPIDRSAIYKWPRIGIPDRHWPVVMKLSGATANQMLAANVAARAEDSTSNRVA